MDLVDTLGKPKQTNLQRQGCYTNINYYNCSFPSQRMARRATTKTDKEAAEYCRNMDQLIGCVLEHRNQECRLRLDHHDE
ncbi:unnamed protein product [Arabis nemorensis]|uniref:Uncharacterized protein n=1 Tax=Arabis nemorensis TaxID=586526 RepID=A0A565AX12_9BRAS|nr:unnamed protein product [Arabis nemorensis]